MGDGRVAGRRLGVMERARARAADHRLLDAAVLIAQGDLEVEDALAVALEAEVAGLDDARMHRPDGHLVDLLALDPVEIARARDEGLGLVQAPGVAACP